MEKRLFQLLVLIFGASFIWIVWHPLWHMDLNEAVSPNNDERIVFQIEKGSPAKLIADELKKDGLIVNKKSFIRTLESEELTGDLRAGSFVLSPSMTLRDIITILTTEGSGESAITILEGWTIQDIDNELSGMDLIESGEFTECASKCLFEKDFLEANQSLEGFLFPDTYFIDAATFNVESFINQLLNTFDTRFTDEMMADVANSGRTLQEIVNVASMIEKEVNTPQDIPIVGGIIWKRLDNNWTLGIDATLLYVQDDNILTVEDLQEDTPYNTRTKTGLPPTPISNPGLASLNGALYPEESEYWFYLTTLDTGEVIYSITNAEHEENKSIYLR